MTKDKPSLIGAILRKPSMRTQFEAMMTGIIVIILASLFSSIYLIFFTHSSLFLKIVAGFGEIGVLLMMLSNLASTYVQYYTFKMAMGMYSLDGLVTEEAGKEIIQEENKSDVFLPENNNEKLKGGIK